MSADLREIEPSEARRIFCKGPIGVWESYLGGGNDMLIGMRLVFHRNGTGTMDEWGFDEIQVNPNYVLKPDFVWRSTGDRQIEMTHDGETRLVSVDFRKRVNEYGTVELRMFDTEAEPDEYGEMGFWKCPFSLVYRGPEPDTPKKSDILRS